MKHELLFSTSLRAKLEKLSQQSVVARYLLLKSNVPYNPLLNEQSPHHCTIRDSETVISYMPKGKEQTYNEEGEWERTGRQTIRIGRWVRQMLRPEIFGNGHWDMPLKEAPTSENDLEHQFYIDIYWRYDQNCHRFPKITDKNLEDFVNQLQAQFEGDMPFMFEIVSGRDIAKYYNKRTYARDENDCTYGTLWNSCMRSEDNDVFDIYTENPEVCSMLCLFSKPNKLVMGRALVWKLTDGSTFMDRVYTLNDKHVEMFRNYAIERGWFFKSINSNDTYMEVSNDGVGAEQKKMQVKLKYADFENYPYMDTFRYARISKPALFSNYLTVECEVTTQHTDHEWDRVRKHKCEFSGEVFENAHDLMQVNYGRMAGSMVHYTYLRETNRGWVLSDDTFFDEVRGYCHHIDDMVHDYRGRKILKGSAVIFQGQLVSMYDKDFLFKKDFNGYQYGYFGKKGKLIWREIINRPDFIFPRDKAVTDRSGRWLLPQDAVVFAGHYYHFNDAEMVEMRKQDAVLRAQIRKIRRAFAETGNPLSIITDAFAQFSNSMQSAMKIQADEPKVCVGHISAVDGEIINGVHRYIAVRDVDIFGNEPERPEIPF